MNIFIFLFIFSCVLLIIFELLESIIILFGIKGIIAKIAKKCFSCSSMIIAVLYIILLVIILLIKKYYLP